MGKQIRYYLLVLCFLCTGRLFGQSQRGDYCSCRAAASYAAQNKASKKAIYAFTRREADSTVISIANPTMDTLYLFSSYLRPEFYGSKHLHRIDLKKQLYKFSFLPVIPRLFVKYADNITDDPVMGQNQVVYDFIKLPPGSKEDIRISDKDLFSMAAQQNNVSEDYNVRQLNKYSKAVPTRLHTVNILKSALKAEFEFAIYRSVALLCDQQSFYMNERAFDKQSKDFKTLIISFKEMPAVRQKK